MLTRRNLRDRGTKGAALVEYAILVGMISVLVIVAVLMLGREVRDNFATVATVLSSEVDAVTIGYLDDEGGSSGSEEYPEGTGIPRYENGAIGCLTDVGGWMPIWCYDDGVETMPEGVISRINDQNFGEGGTWGQACAWDTIAGMWVQSQDPSTGSIYLACDEYNDTSGGAGGGDMNTG